MADEKTGNTSAPGGPVETHGHASEFESAPAPAPLADWVSVPAWAKYLDDWDAHLTTVAPHPYVELVYAKLPPNVQGKAKRVHVYVGIFALLSLLTIATLGLEFFSHFVAFAPVIMHTLHLISSAHKQPRRGGAHKHLTTDAEPSAAAAAAAAAAESEPEPEPLDEAVQFDGFSRDKQEYVWLLSYWVLYALLTVLESFLLPHAHRRHHHDAGADAGDAHDHDGDDGMGFASFAFHVFHVVFLMWCHSPVTRGSLVVYRKVFVPLRAVLSSFLSGHTATAAAKKHN